MCPLEGSSAFSLAAKLWTAEPGCQQRQPLSAHLVHFVYCPSAPSGLSVQRSGGSAVAAVAHIALAG